MKQIIIPIFLLCIASLTAIPQSQNSPPTDSITESNFAETVFHSRVSFNKTAFLNLANFRSTDFKKNAYFVEAQFDSLAYFMLAKFHDEANFNRADFDLSALFFAADFGSLGYFNSIDFHDLAGFTDADFHDKASFMVAKFHDEANFQSAQFDSIASFIAAKFHEEANFQGAQFNNGVDFLSTQFDSSASFIEAKFHDKASFRGAQFNGLVNFFIARFDSLLNFNGAEFKKGLYLYGSSLPMILDFSGVKTTEIIDLTVAGDSTQRASDHICYINFFDAPIEKFKLRYDIFRVWKPKPPISTLDYEKLTNVYEGLSKNFKDHGYLNSLQTLDKEYQEFKFIQNPNKSKIGLWVGRRLNFINKYWNDYGYDKSRIWLFTIGLFSFFCLLNWIGLLHLSSEVYAIQNVDNALRVRRIYDQKKVRINLRGFDLAVYYTVAVFFGLKITPQNLNLEAKAGVAYIFIQYIVGLICLAYLANFVISSHLIGT